MNKEEKLKLIEQLAKPKAALDVFFMLSMADVKDWIFEDKILCFGKERGRR